MNLIPKYALNIIVGVVFENTFKWYVTDSEIWYLDLRKLIDAYEKKGYKIPNPDDFSERFDIDIIDTNNASEFLKHIKEFSVDTSELRNLIVNQKYDHISELVPSLYINFQEKILISEYPEPVSFEKYIPDEWIGLYGVFLDKIPHNYKYWIVDDKNFFEVKNEQ